MQIQRAFLIIGCETFKAYLNLIILFIIVDKVWIKSIHLKRRILKTALTILKIYVIC